MRKRILCAMLALLMIVTLLPVVVGADANPTITFVQQATPAGASEVKVDVKITNNPGFVSATIPVKWDASIMTLTGVAMATDVVDTGWCGMNMDEYAANGTQGTYYLAWDNDTRTEGDFTGDGKLAVLTFALVNDAVDTNTEITSNLSAAIANMMNYDMADLRDSGLTAVAGVVNVTAADAGGDEPEPEPSDGAQVTFTVDGKSNICVGAGDDFDIIVNVSGCKGISSLTVCDFEIDSQYITVNNMEWLLQGSTFSDIGEMPIVAFDVTDGGARDINGEVFKISCTAAEIEGEEISTKISCAVEAEIPNSENLMITTKEVLKVNANTVTIRSYTPGDMNGDEYLNTADAIYLVRHIFRPTAYPLSYGQGDMNGDGYVNTADAIYLVRHIFRPNAYPLH